MKQSDKVVTSAAIAERFKKMTRRAVAEDKSKSYDETKHTKKTPSQSTLNRLSGINSEKMLAAETILQTTPDTSRAMNIITGLVCCPNGGSRVQLNFLAGRDGDYTDEAGVVTSIVEKIEDYFKNVLNIEATQYRKLYKILSKEGAEVIGIIPDNTVDELINSDVNSSVITTESLYIKGVTSTKDKLTFSSIGYLGNGIKADGSSNITLESAFSGVKTRTAYNPHLNHPDLNCIQVIDNPNILKLPTLVEYNDAVRANMALETFRGGMKGKDGIHPNFYVKRDYKVCNAVAIPNPTKFKGTGRPQLIRFPAATSIPVHYPGDPTKRFGVFVLIDESGAPLNSSVANDTYSDLSEMRNNSDDSKGTGQVLSSVRNKTDGSQFKLRDNELSYQELQRSFTSFIEADFKERLKNGTASGNYDIGDSETFYRIMFQRALAQKQTRVVFLPDAMVSYQAVNYDENGVGVSLVGKNRLMATIRTVLFLANFMASLNNSVQKKKVNIRFDELDKNVGKTLEMIAGELIFAQASPLNALAGNGPADMLTSLQQGAYDFDFEDVDMPGLPKTNVKIEDVKRDIQEVNTDFQNEVRQLQMMDYGLAPEMVDNSFSPQFAAQVYRENDLTARMISEIVEAVADYNTDFVRKYVALDSVLLDEIMEEIKIPKGARPTTDEGEENNINDHSIKLDFVKEALSVLYVCPPNPEMNNMDANVENFDKFVTALDTVLNAKFSDKMSNALRGALGDNYDIAKDAIRSYYVEVYLKQSNMLKELTEGLSDPERFEAIMKSQLEDTESFMQTILKQTKILSKYDAKGDIVADRVKEEEDAKEQARKDKEDEERRLAEEAEAAKEAELNGDPEPEGEDTPPEEVPEADGDTPPEEEGDELPTGDEPEDGGETPPEDDDLNPLTL